MNLVMLLTRNLFLTGFCFLLTVTFQAAQAEDQAVAEVNGQKITASDLQLEFLLKQIPEKDQQEHREQVINSLIEQKLIRAILQRQQLKVNQVRLEAATENLYQLIRKADREPQELLEEIGITEETLKQQLELPLLWQVYLEQVVTPERLRSYFKKHRLKFDGTEFRLSQIYFKSPPEGEATSQLQQLKNLKRQINSGEITFSEAARKHSEAPSAKNGGDIGYTPYSGKMPTFLTDQVIELKSGEMSEPFVSPFGVHLFQVTEIKPGELSLEDVRPLVWEQISHQLWERKVNQLRSSAHIKIY